MKACERCGATAPNDEAGDYELFDYCELCSRDLCDKCMRAGCCGHTPAVSGMVEDAADNVPPPPSRNR